MVGTGYVGLVSGACFAEMGHDVVCVDIDLKKVNALTSGQIPIYEPGLEEIVKSNVSAGRLRFSTTIDDALASSHFVFIAVGTPPDEDGSADLKHVLSVAREVGQKMTDYKVIVDKSTVPVGTADLVTKTIQAELSKRNMNVEFEVVSNPEFLKEGDAISDFMRPDRIVVGANSAKARELMGELYAPFVRNGHPILLMDVKSAELTKYAANSMLATRISFMNELSMLCERVGADIEEVRKGIGTDSRIGMPFLYAGLGYGGSCFPKDVQALGKTMVEHQLSSRILNAVETVNKEQRQNFLQKIVSKYGNDLKGKIFAVWGLAFKPKTDDMREAPSLYLCHELHKRGATLHMYDPEAMDVAKSQMPQDRVFYANEMYGALESADALLLLTEWSQFRNPDFAKVAELMKAKVIFDGRNQYNPRQLAKLGFEYACIGRPSSRAL